MKYLYEEMTWPEIKECADSGKIAIVPVGSVEDHGLHLPVITDNLIAESMCNEVGKRIPEKVVVLPCSRFGFEAHHMDFPGSIDVHYTTLINLWTDIGKSLARHNFKKIIFVNGHGSNTSALDLAARQINLETNSMAIVVSWWSLIREEASKIRESEFPGGACHACELETSFVMHLRPDLVKMDLLTKEIPESTKFMWRDLLRPCSVTHMGWWSSATETGTMGDATVATPEKGEKLLEYSVQKLIELVEDFEQKQFKPRKEHH